MLALLLTYALAYPNIDIEDKGKEQKITVEMNEYCTITHYEDTKKFLTTPDLTVEAVLVKAKQSCRLNR